MASDRKHRARVKSGGNEDRGGSGDIDYHRRWGLSNRSEAVAPVRTWLQNGYHIGIVTALLAFIYFYLFEREREQERGREKERESQAGFTLSIDPNMKLNPTMVKSPPRGTT